MSKLYDDQYKILWMSDNPKLITGYANQSRNICKRLARESWCDLHYFAIQGLGAPCYVKHDPLRLYGSRVDGSYVLWPPGKSRWGEDMIQHYVKKEIKPDLLCVLLDSFMLHYMIDTRKYPRGMDLSPTKKLFYFPSDGAPLPENTPTLFKRFEYLVAMAKWGQKQAVEAGFVDCKYIPHAVDEKDFYELPDVQKSYWRRFWGVKEDAFVALSVFRNQGRKMPSEMLKAWAKFSKGKDDVLLVLHSDPLDPASGVNLNSLIKKFGVEKSVKWTGMNWNCGFSVKELRGLYNMADIHTLSTCFHPNTKISMNNGFKNIEDINIGDFVLTDDGTFKEVEDKIDYEYKGDLLNVITQYNPNVLLTPNHKVYGVHSKPLNDYWKKKVKKNPKIVLKPINKFGVGDYLIVPRIKKVKDKQNIVFEGSYVGNQFGLTDTKHPRAKELGNVLINNDLMWFFGMYLAEGCISQRKNKPDGIIFSINSNEQEYTNYLLQIGLKSFGLRGVIKDDTRHRRKIIFYSASLGRKFKEMFSSGAKHKKIPKWMIYLPHWKQRRLIKGYINGDGYVTKNKKSTTIRADTVSERLAYDLRNILIRLGKLVGYSTQKRESLVHRICWTENGKNSIGFFDDDFMYVRINKISKKKYEGLVYDLTVSENHNYCNYWLGKNSGEGFGIPVIESMVCGTPNVLPDFTTPKELLGDNGLLASVHTTITGQYNVERGIVNTDSLANGYQTYYDNRDLLKDHSSKGVKRVKENYVWRRTYPEWRKLFRRIRNG